MKRTHALHFAFSAFMLLGFATGGSLAQETWSGTAVGAGPPQDLSGEIRWKKTLGTVPIVAGLSAQHSDPCSAFHILVVTADHEQTLIRSADLTWKLKAGEFNICQFKTTVPSNIPIRVYPAMGRKNGSTEQQDHLYLRGGWSGGEKIPYDTARYGIGVKGRNFYSGNLIDPQPETGYKRGFEPRSRELTLTRATFISFEMVYILNRFGAYPKYTEPPPPAPKPPFITAGQPIIPPYMPYGIVHLGWEGGPDHPNVEVFVSMDNGAEIPAFSMEHSPQSPVWKQPKMASIPLRLQRYHHYKFVLKADGKTLSTAAFVVP